MKKISLLGLAAVFITGCAGQPDSVGAPAAPARGVNAAEEVATPEAPEVISLFDGETLAGWHVMQASEDGNYQQAVENYPVRDGAIHCVQLPNRKGAMLLSDATFQDFELELEVWSDWGCDSGVMLRSTDRGRGFQVLNDYLKDGCVGFAFGQGSGGFISRPIMLNKVGDRVVARDVYDAVRIDKLEHAIDAQTWNRTWVQDGWNTLKIRCVGTEPLITTWVNGIKVMGFNGAVYRGRALKHEMVQNWDTKTAWNAERFRTLTGGRGSIGLQVHPGGRWAKGGAVRYRNIRVLDLTPAPE